MIRIVETTDYDKLELSDFNRDIQRTKLLEASMRQHGFSSAYPLHVVRDEDGTLKIKGGHHRFVIARKLGIPVKYVVCEDNMTIHQIEKTTTKWTLKDYLASWVRLNRQEYIAVRDYHEKTGIPLGLCTGLMRGQQSSGNFYESFKDGTYKTSEYSIAEPVGEIVMGCSEIGVKFARNPLFVEAIAQCVLTGEFSAETFLAKVKCNPSLMKKQASKEGYLDLIEYVYNYRSQKKIPIGFMAREAARKRLFMFGKNGREQRPRA